MMTLWKTGNPLNLLTNLVQCAASDGWFQRTEDLSGMIYDLDAAIMSGLGINDTNFSLDYDEEGNILGSITIHHPVQSLDELDKLFFKLWGMVCFGWSFTHREVNSDTISYLFITGNESIGYRGSITFTGPSIQQFLQRSSPHTVQ